MTIQTKSNHYVVTYPDGMTLRCQNLATAHWYVRQYKKLTPVLKEGIKKNQSS